MGRTLENRSIHPQMSHHTIHFRVHMPDRRGVVHVHLHRDLPMRLITESVDDGYEKAILFLRGEPIQPHLSPRDMGLYPHIIYHVYARRPHSRAPVFCEWFRKFKNYIRNM